MSEPILPDPMPRRDSFSRTLDLSGRNVGDRLEVTGRLKDDDHDFVVSLTISRQDGVLRAIGVRYIRAPFGECFREGGSALQSLVGQPVGFDFKKKVRAVLKDGAGCLHLVSLLTALGDS